MENLMLKIERKVLTNNYTEGNFYVNNRWFCHVVEDAVRDKPGFWKKIFKIKHKTAIPYGRYRVVLTFSNRFQKIMPLITNVPDFDGIRIHNGVSADSSSGCPIISYKAGSVKGTVINDRAAMNELIRIIENASLKGLGCFIEIV